MTVARIKELCNERGLSINELERMIGLSENSIYKWDISRPSVDKAILASKALGCQVDELFKERRQK